MDTTSVNEAEEIQLNATDRCDQCGAQAFVQTFFSSGYLLFCAHHYKEHEASLEQSVKYVYDRRDMLEPSRPTPEEVQ